MRKILFFLTLATFIVYYVSSTGNTPYDYFTRLASAFLHGKYYLNENPAWLNELIPIGTERFAVVYPPAPSIVLLPFIIIFGDNFRQQILSQVMGALAAFVWGYIAYIKTKSKKGSLWMFFLAAFGNIVWYLSANGSVWYLGQVSGYLFFTLAIYESLTKKRPVLTGIYFSLAVFSRLQILLGIPLILYLNKDNLRNIKNLIYLFGPIIFSGTLYGVYNYLRFGSFTQTGYSLIPGVLTEPWYLHGIFNYSYVIDNLRVMFLSLPNFKNKFPFITPSWGGLSVILTSPVFIYVLFAKIKDRINIVSWAAIIFISLVIFTHGGTGFTQFGYRYAVDFYPPIFLLITNSLKNTGIKWHHLVLLVLSIMVNFWGVLFINLGFVGY